MLLLSLSSYGGLKFSHLHREKALHSCLCTLGSTENTYRDPWNRNPKSFNIFTSEGIFHAIMIIHNEEEDYDALNKRVDTYFFC